MQNLSLYRMSHQYCPNIIAFLSPQTQIQGVPPISTHVWFQFLTLLIVLSKKNLVCNKNSNGLWFCHFDTYKISKIEYFFFMLKKNCQNQKKNLHRPSPPWAIFFPLGHQREKLPLGDQMEKKSFGGPKEKKTSFFMPLEKLFFFFWSPKGSFFPLWYPKGKKIAQGGEGRCKFFFWFWQFFFNMKKNYSIFRIL